jgi:hypothetical protein
LEEGEYQSLVGRLNDAAKVTRSGRVYMCGLYSASRRRNKMGRVVLDAWAIRNLIWWEGFLSVDTPPTKIFRPRIKTAKKFCPHTDASTSYGYGGFWIVGDTCYYIHGEWTDAEKELIENKNLLFEDKDGVQHKMGINFLEMAAVWMLLATADGVFEEDEFTFYCDNETTVKILTSYRTRTLPTATLLENIDQYKSIHQKQIEWDWIATEKNTESDLISRGEISRFMDHVRKTYNVFVFKHLQVPDHARNIAQLVSTAQRNPHWVVADGESGPGWTGGPHSLG